MPSFVVCASCVVMRVSRWRLQQHVCLLSEPALRAHHYPSPQPDSAIRLLKRRAISLFRHLSWPSYTYEVCFFLSILLSHRPLGYIYIYICSLPRYNIIFYWSKCCMMADNGDLEGARQLLVEELDTLSAMRGWTVTVSAPPPQRFSPRTVRDCRRKTDRRAPIQLRADRRVRVRRA